VSAGIGAVPGALIWGWLADRIGRRAVFFGTALNFSIFTGLMTGVRPTCGTPHTQGKIARIKHAAPHTHADASPGAELSKF
jgi:MFS family permease